MTAGELPTLFLLAHAGGSAFSFHNSLKRLKPHFNLIPLELPGHGLRMSEPMALTVEDMVDDLADQAGRFWSPNRPNWIFGHSLGGLNAFLLARAMVEPGSDHPGYLVVSSACVPGQHRVAPGLLELSDSELWRASASSFGFTKEEVSASEELMLMFAPILRTDLAALQSYRPSSPPPPLAWPITVVYAESDVVGEHDMKQWERYSCGPFEIKRVPGGHFHPLENPAPIEDLILGTISADDPVVETTHKMCESR